MIVRRLRTNHTQNPIGFQMDQVRLSYAVEQSVGKRQKAARIQVALDENLEQIVFDSGVVENTYDAEGNMTNGISGRCYDLQISLTERTRYFWQVTVWSDANEEATSEVAYFETAKMSEWKADFITADAEIENHLVLEREILIEKEVSKARIYMLGLGVYELYLNGEKVGNEYLLPGCHEFESWLQYQTFELDLKQGINKLEISLGNGWFKGVFGLKKRLPRFGTEFAAIAEVYVDYADGTEELICTDESWKARKSNVIFDTIYDGEVVDATLDTSEVFHVKKANVKKSLLRARLSPRILCNEHLKPTLVISPKGETILDFGQNMVGWVAFHCEQPYGTKIKLSYGEILQEGNFYRENMRTALCEFTYTSDGNKALVRPHFTYYGFRYVKVEGWQGELNPDDFTGWVIHSEMDRRGNIVTANDKINQLFSNVIWGQKGNFLDVPTDCPQRDERMGWTGDAQVFSDTACFNMDTYMFYEKFGQDLYYEQLHADGAVPYVVPTSRYILGGASMWGDAATVIPWNTYVHFGDKTILEKQFQSMVDWVEYMYRQDEADGGKRLWLTGKHFGDWLALDGKVEGGVYGRTDCYFIATACYYYSTMLLVKSAKVLGKEVEYAKYKKLASEIKQAFVDEYYTKTGKLAIDTQTAYAIVVAYDLVPEVYKERISRDFRKKMMENGFVLETGFAGTPYLLSALSECGHADVAYQMLLREEYPSWLYEVNMGATTVWERWNSVMPDGSMNPQGMNSLNHYAYGSVAAWMYRYMCGINPMEEKPGFVCANIHPYPNLCMQHVEATVESNIGTWKSGWAYEGDKLTVQVEVPFGATAVVDFADCGTVEKDTVKLEAGKHRFTLTLEKEESAGWNLESDWRKALEDEKAKAVMEEYFPRAYHGNIAFQEEMYTIQELINSPFSEMYGDAITKLEEALKAIK